MKTPLLFLITLAFSALPLVADEAKPTAPAAAVPVVKDVTPDEAEKLLKENPKIVVLDVRTPEEFAKGHIAGAKNVDFLAGDVAKQAPKLDPQTPILVHCAAGGRSGQSLPLLKDKQVVYHLKDGFKAWEKAGKPVEK
jgi:Rhodanese-related sulfurtransferase